MSDPIVAAASWAHLHADEIREGDWYRVEHRVEQYRDNPKWLAEKLRLILAEAKGRDWPDDPDRWLAGDIRTIVGNTSAFDQERIDP